MDSTIHAFPSSSPGAAAASWNPALRANAEPVDDRDDDFFERYPGPTPKKTTEAADAVLPDNSEEPLSPIRGHSTLGQQDVDIDRLEDEHTQRINSDHIGVIPRPISELYEEEDEEALRRDEELPILAPGETVAEQELALEARLSEDGSRDLTTTDGSVTSLRNSDQEDVAAEHYEHQGEITELDQALEPSASASLLQNEAPLPIAGPTSRSETMALPSVQPIALSDSEPATTAEMVHSKQQMKRTFTTDFAASPVEAPLQSQDVPDEWPSVGDDRTFEELLGPDNATPSNREALAATAAEEALITAAPDVESSPEETKNQILEATAAEEAQTIAAPDWDLLPEDEGDVKEEDLAAAWGAAFDDDDMLEDTPADLDPSAFFGEDDEGFLLEEEPEVPAMPQVPRDSQQTLAPSAQYRPTSNQTSLQPPASVTDSQFFDPGGHGRSAGTPSTGLQDVYGYFGGAVQPSQQRPALVQQAQSFSDKAKGGYQSPYDLPMEVVKPRRRPQQISQQPAPTPPPRSTSISSPTGPPAINQAHMLNSASVAPFSPPPSRGSGMSGGVPVASANTMKSPPSTSSGFFEELPMAPKLRTRPSTAYTPQPAVGVSTPPLQAGPVPPTQGFGQHPPVPASVVAPTPPVSQQPSIYGGLRQPERLPLLPDQPNVPIQQQQQGPAPNARYSPSTQASHVQNRNISAPASSRYSPAPAAQSTQAKARQPSMPNTTVHGSQTSHAFAPRTSSPLAAYTDKLQPPLPSEQGVPRVLPSVSPSKPNVLQMTPPDSVRSSRYSPAGNQEFESAPQFAGAIVQRPQTQSPDATMKQGRAIMPPSTDTLAASQGVPQPKRPALPHRRQFSRESIFAVPQDERAQDPLQRWKGYPIFKWSASGMILSAFPKQTPFYASGTGGPSIKCTPGSVSVQDAAQFMPLTERNAKFPGPLQARSKNRKKEVLTWMTGKIDDLEQRSKDAAMDFSIPADLKKRAEEKVILWKLMRIFLEHDGVLDGNAKSAEEIREILLPNLAQMAQVAELQSPGSAVVERDAVDKHVTLQLRQALLEGRREHAVWLAEEKRLWGHAMLIASTMGPDTWKQIVQAFVRNQVKSFGSDARSLAALYQVFAGNSEECVDELVPPSARAGFQMISLADGNKSGNPLEGLDQWRETLGLVTSNRTSNDAPSLVAIGKMLSGYGRAEAAHTCFLFARTLVKHSGFDDAEADFILLGANHKAKEESFGSDLDSIILTEIYEYAMSLTASTTTPPYIPHLQAYKLVHAQELAAHGLKTKASTYCDAITSACTSTTRLSPYYHTNLLQAVADMSAFLSQTPLDGKSGTLRPTLNKVSSSATNWLANFITGDDDKAPTGSGAGVAGGEGGPFGGVSGDSGDVSRTASGTDLYMQGFGGMSNPALSQSFVPTSTPSRYAPGAPASSFKSAPAQSYSPMGMPSAEPQRPGSSRYAPAPAVNPNLGMVTQELTRKPSNYSLNNASGSRRGSGQDYGLQSSYEPRPVVTEDTHAYGYSPHGYTPLHESIAPSPLLLPHEPSTPQEPRDAFPQPNGLGESLGAQETMPDPETQGGYEPSASGYEPPSYTYEPYQPEPDSPDGPRPRKMYGDDDDDDDAGATAQMAAAQKKAAADREADELFRKAAEADAARDKEKAGAKKGWGISSWWGAPKDKGIPSSGPIKAKLGEENSFYFDKDLGKWVNKKGGAEAAAAASPTPPPPKGVASRAISASMGPPSGPPMSRSSSAGGMASMSRPPTSGSAGPPSRAATPGSNADATGPTSIPSGINGDSPALSAVPPPMRPQSSLSTASSIDDLLGAPGARKGGTVKGKKKGGRYVDVMAK